MSRRLLTLLLIVLLTAAHATAQQPATLTDSSTRQAGAIPRTVIAMWDSRVEKQWEQTVLHQLAEMPLNHLGLVLEPHDVNAALPDLSGRADVRGVITWFQGAGMSEPLAYLEWARRVVEGGRRYVAVGDWGFLTDAAGHPIPLEDINGFLSRLGLEDEGTWKPFPYDLHPVVADELIGFESSLSPALPAFTAMRRVSETVVSHLSVGKGPLAVTSDLVVTGPAGAYAAAGYTYYGDDTPHRRWIIDPFEFFRRAFNTDDLPKPDVTTLNGRRIYYSQIDGDGWRNVSLAATGGEIAPRSIDILLRETIRPYPDLPVTVAPIAADLDPRWCGDDRAQQAAREVFALAQVEAGSHTYSHPLEWQFFASYRPGQEQPYESSSIHCHSDHWAARFAGAVRGTNTNTNGELRLSAAGDSGSRPLRSFADQPFDLDQEISGAARYISQFLPAGKSVAIIQWSGNSLPFAEAIRRAHRAGLPALNGGDTRFDPEFPSVAWVRPIGRWEAGALQIYASSSNENTYTDDWSRRYYGYKYLPATLERTGSPRRLKPIDVYYHVYSGDRPSSIAALKQILHWVESQELAPVRTSQYARIAEGFYSTELVPIGARAWRVERRGALQTIRLDDAMQEDVDWSRSAGVLGSRRTNGSLYVALDPQVPRPVIALGPAESEVRAPVLIHSRWQIRSLQRTADGFGTRFSVSGFGPGEMLWRVPRSCPHWGWTLTRANRPVLSGQVDVSPRGDIALALERLASDEGAVAIQCLEQRG